MHLLASQDTVLATLKKYNVSITLKQPKVFHLVKEAAKKFQSSLAFSQQNVYSLTYLQLYISISQVGKSSQAKAKPSKRLAPSVTILYYKIPRYHLEQYKSTRTQGKVMSMVSDSPRILPRHTQLKGTLKSKLWSIVRFKLLQEECDR